MIAFAILRHGPTRWNAEGRIQGQWDVPLSEAGRAAVLGWRLPAALAGCDWYASPLQRARETARLLGIGAAHLEPALMEASWGRWEGALLAELRARHGRAMAENEARGLDFRPPGGESPRDLQARVRRFLARVARRGRPAAAVAHQGVIRALYADAVGWDMTGEPPQKLLDRGLHRFLLDADGGRLRALEINVALAP